MPIKIVPTNKGRDAMGGGGMDIGKTKKKKKKASSYAGGGSLKPVPEGNKGKGLSKLQTEVWGHNSKLETHTVETHIYRLRKKINNIFSDENFIKSSKAGYIIQ